MPKARPRLVLSSKAFMPKKYKNSRLGLSWALIDARNKLRGLWSLDGLYSLECTFGLRKRDKGDLDNLVGTVMDAGNGILWFDDTQVVHLSVVKQPIGDRVSPWTYVGVTYLGPQRDQYEQPKTSTRKKA